MATTNTTESHALTYPAEGATGWYATYETWAQAITDNFDEIAATRVATLKDTNGNEQLELAVTASAVNHFQITNAATGGHPEFAAVGDDTDINAVITPKGAGVIDLNGTTKINGTTLSSAGLALIDDASAADQATTLGLGTGDSPTFVGLTISADVVSSNQTAPGAGTLGEEIKSTVATGSAVTLSSGVTANITSITLTAGIWDISGWVGFTETGSDMSGKGRWQGIISATTASVTPIAQESATHFGGIAPYPDTSMTDLQFPITPTRIVITENTTYYLNVNAIATTNFGAESYGTLRAVRVA